MFTRKEIEDEHYEDDIFDDLEPEDVNKFLDVAQKNYQWGNFEEYWLVGHGEVTNDFCGKYKHIKGCLNVAGHNVTNLVGQSFHGKVYVKKVHNWCCKPSCPVCYKRGWAVREAGNVEHRFKESSKKFGLVEHIIVGVAYEDFDLDLDRARKKVINYCNELGIHGGCLIFHPFRYKKLKGWFFSPHWHILGHIFGGFKCRGCPKRLKCSGDCDGFNARRWKLFQRSHYYFKVLAKRKTIFGTAWYQLNHAGYVEGKKRNHVLWWFGSCSYRKLKVTKRMREEFCPLCHSVLKVLKFKGKLSSLPFTDEELKEGAWFDFVDDLSGEVMWSVDTTHRECKSNEGSPLYEMAGKQGVLVAKVEDSFYPCCYLCNEPITDLADLSNIRGRLVHVACRKAVKCDC